MPAKTITNCLFPILLLVAIIACNNNTQSTKESKSNTENKTPDNDSSTYQFLIPKGWTSETMSFPIEFAPKIPYTGIEDLRFSPGWEPVENEEHWTYSFLWWLNGDVKIDENILQQNLKEYYTGLVGRNIEKRGIPFSKVLPVDARINKIATANSDIETYQGTITMTDYLDKTFKPITLNCMVHRKNCLSHTALIFQVSPQPNTHPIWKTMNKLQEDFKCGN
jgi:hypothetical protein